MKKKNIFFYFFILFFTLSLVLIKQRILNISTTADNIHSFSPETPTPTPKLLLIGATAYWDEEEAIISLRHAAGKISVLSPSFYAIDTDGTLINQPGKYKNEFIKLARQNNLQIFPLVGDKTHEGVIRLLQDKKLQNQVINQIVQETVDNYFDGIALDIEKLETSDREEFSQLVKNLATALHAKGKKLQVILFAKSSENSSSVGSAQDYAFIGEVADNVGIMLFNFSNASTPPGPQAPLNWYRDTLSYVTSLIPRDKIIIGLTTHGYDWGAQRIEEVTYQEVKQRLQNAQWQAMYDTKNLSAVARYHKFDSPHTIWYEDARAIKEKIKIARSEFGISNFALWRLGAEDPKLWEENWLQ